MCLPENIIYDSINYEWISKRYKNFIYIDRIAVIKEFQNKKLGTALYSDLINHSKKEQYDIILCEVLTSPPNHGSIRFHKRFDFEECGSQFTEGGTLESYDYSVEVQFLKRDDEDAMEEVIHNIEDDYQESEDSFDTVSEESEYPDKTDEVIIEELDSSDPFEFEDSSITL